MRRPGSNERLLAGAPLALVVLLGCGGSHTPDPLVPRDATIEEIAAQLDAMNGLRVPAHRETFREILADSIAKDAYACRPMPRDVFFGDAPEGERTISGQMPHYGFFFGPMSYRVARSRERWRVRIVIAVVPPDPDAMLELPDCTMGAELDEPTACAEDAERASSLEVCPRHPRGFARATDRTVTALLRRYSREVATYWSRDAHAQGLPIDYEFRFERAHDADPTRVDMTLPLATTCGRTPYFSSLRSGWSLPIVAHEMGHVLGLLDEYETFSGMLYRKTPFPGAEVSRMGLSMREGTKVLPVHHYLVLRRWFCRTPREKMPFRDVFP
jgi:hypothetical protein